MIELYLYPKCSTCKKAEKWLRDHEIIFESIDMVSHVPSAELLNKWLAESELPIRRFFNTSGMKYRELGLKEKVSDMTKAQACQLLATDGMLIKRPILVKDGQFKAIGFKEDQYEEVFQLG